MSELPADGEPLIVESGIRVPYSWWAGDTIGRYLVSLRDACRILGTRCERCDRVMVPPRKTCPLCFAENLPWVPLPDTGTLQGFTVIRKPRAAFRRELPAVVGLIRLDGATTAMLHAISEVDPEAVHIGMRLQAKFAQDRRGHILDIAYFRPMPS